MKKLLALLAISGSIVACNNSGTSETTATDTATKTVAPAADTIGTTSTTPAAKDSLMQFKDGKVLISLNGAWSPLSAAVTTTNGRKVSPDGEVSKNGKTRKLEEGMMIDKDGQLLDKEGKLVDNTGWE